MNDRTGNSYGYGQMGLAGNTTPYQIARPQPPAKPVVPQSASQGLAAYLPDYSINPDGTVNSNHGQPDWARNNPSQHGWQNFASGAGGVMSLASALTSLREMKLMEEQLNMQTGLANRNLANSAATTNLSLANQAHMAAQMNGFAPGTPEYDAYIQNNRVTVDGSPVA